MPRAVEGEGEPRLPLMESVAVNSLRILSATSAIKQDRMVIKPMKKTALAFPARRRLHRAACVDPVVGDILSGWRYDISGLSPAMRTDYDQHLVDCDHCRHHQRVARTIDVLLICVSTLSIAAFLLAAVVIHRVELVTHIDPGIWARWCSSGFRRICASALPKTLPEGFTKSPA
jgi:hypothetical protein